MNASCNKDSSSSEFSESFSENGNSFYSGTSSEMNSDYNLLDEYYENDFSRDLSATIDTQNSNNDDQWIQIANRAIKYYFKNYRVFSYQHSWPSRLW